MEVPDCLLVGWVQNVEELELCAASSSSSQVGWDGYI